MIPASLLLLTALALTRGCQVTDHKPIGQPCSCSDACLDNSYCLPDGGGGTSCQCLPCQYYDQTFRQCLDTPGIGEPCRDHCAANLQCLPDSQGSRTCKCPANQYYDPSKEKCVNLPGHGESCSDVCASNLVCQTSSTGHRTCQCPPQHQYDRYQDKCVLIPGAGESCSGVCQSNLVCVNNKCQCSAGLVWNSQENKCSFACVNNNLQGCSGLANGDYPACFPQCQQGVYITCSNGYLYVRDCAQGWFIKPDKTWFTDKLVYDPILKRCEYRTTHCPRPLDSQVVA